VAYYTNIRPGDYRFRVIASNGDGVWNQIGAAFDFRLRPRFYQTPFFPAAVGAGIVGLMSAAYHRRVTTLRRRNLEQQAFSRQLIQSQERERQRIAAELHDSLGQNLLIIKNRAVFGAMASQDHAPSREQFDEITTSMSQSIEEVRQIAYNLRPYHLDRLGLTQALEEMVERVADASRITFSTELDPVDGIFSKDAEISLFRIVQESVNNIVKHSSATEARVQAVRDGPRLRITVWDNGKGFTPRDASGGAERGFGLAGMAERVRMLGGARTIQSVPGQGTTVAIELELPARFGQPEESHERI
jgi:signal transduction histidine kinase